MSPQPVKAQLSESTRLVYSSVEPVARTCVYLYLPWTCVSVYACRNVRVLCLCALRGRGKARIDEELLGCPLYKDDV